MDVAAGVAVYGSTSVTRQQDSHAFKPCSYCRNSSGGPLGHLTLTISLAVSHDTNSCNYCRGAPSGPLAFQNSPGRLALLSATGSPIRWLQEYFLEDLVEVAVYIGQHVPHLAAGQQMEDLIIALIVFQGSPAYVKNPFLRSRMAEVST